MAIIALEVHISLLKYESAQKYHVVTLDAPAHAPIAFVEIRGNFLSLRLYRVLKLQLFM